MEWFAPKVEVQSSDHRPPCLFGHTCCRIGRDLYLIGGCVGNGMGLLSHCHFAPFLHHSSPFHALGCLHSDTFLIGLANAAYKLTIFNENTIFWDLARFEIPSDVTIERVGHSAVRHNSQLIIFGGHNGKVCSEPQRPSFFFFVLPSCRDSCRVGATMSLSWIH